MDAVRVIGLLGCCVRSNRRLCSYAGWSPACARSLRAASSCGTARFDALMCKEFWGFGPVVLLFHSVILLDRLSSLMAGFILVLNHSWLCTVRSAQSSGSKLLRSLEALARVREAIDTGEGRGGARGPVCIWCRYGIQTVYYVKQLVFINISTISFYNCIYHFIHLIQITNHLRKLNRY